MLKVLLLVALLGAICVSAQKYGNKYDNADIQMVLRSERLLKNYVNCLLDRGRCTPEGLDLKSK